MKASPTRRARWRLLAGAALAAAAMLGAACNDDEGSVTVIGTLQ